jgi:predicted Rossmann fold nucleotide-binding protein DprA/Smf involved in DNA uptake
VLAVPGRPDDPRYTGNLALVRDGAGVFTAVSDVLLAFGIVAEASQADKPPRGPTRAGVPVTIPWSSPLPSVGLGPLADLLRRRLDLEAELALDDLLEGMHPKSPGAHGVGVSAAELTALLTAMELTGEVERTVGGRYRLRRVSAADD